MVVIFYFVCVQILQRNGHIWRTTDSFYLGTSCAYRIFLNRSWVLRLFFCVYFILYFFTLWTERKWNTVSICYWNCYGFLTLLHTRAWTSAGIAASRGQVVFGRGLKIGKIGGFKHIDLFLVWCAQVLPNVLLEEKPDGKQIPFQLHQETCNCPCQVTRCCLCSFKGFLSSIDVIFP